MHALAIDLQDKGYQVTGSDDEIYDPSLSRLQEAGLAPEKMGWDASRIDHVDVIILGMHARRDNPELLAAQEKDLPIYSFPSFVAEYAHFKQTIMIAGSHGKTTTTAMIMHVLRKCHIDFDYLVGAEINGFDGMVKLTDAPIMLVEGDEYLSSPIDRRPKFIHFDPEITVITGIAWDHINVFPTEEIYVQQFADLIEQLDDESTLIYYERDPKVDAITTNHEQRVGYSALHRTGPQQVFVYDRAYPISVIGKHNLQNMNAALHVCYELGISTEDFFASIADFTGADRRLQIVGSGENWTVFFDFAHAPSKVMATTQAVKDWYAGRTLVACLELHTYSSLNRDFLPQYNDALATADHAIVFYNDHTLQIKKMPPLDNDYVRECFGRQDLVILTDPRELHQYLSDLQSPESSLLLMSSGRYQGMDVTDIWKD